MIKIKLNKSYASLHDYIKNIAVHFERESDCIRCDRNQVKRIKVGEHDLCVKAFGKPTVFNRWMYSYFRKSKARRSYEFAHYLLKKGVGTPAPIAYVEIYNAWHFLIKSFYICHYENFDYDMANVLAREVDDKRMILRDFVNFMVNQLHAQGICHTDFNGSNVLVKRANVMDKVRYQFLLVDLNRLKFQKPLGYHQGLYNMQQIDSNPEYLTELARFYARFKDADSDDTVYELMLVKSIARLRRRYTKRFLHFLKTMLQ
ncbi:lipopolysaccharide kinase InaA family protein [Carboxylicivirga taeanensis]|uniref:lipopolysaccharide kinase InaA family protein n=1 Tax=Carboxylicivirga taeanensis TaxID=1416875 RepID=UPI003F6DE839